MIYLQLLLSFLQIGLLSIGGGYAALPIIQSQVVDLHHWITMREFADILTISQMTPGPIAINGATFVGTKIAGLPGAIVASVGVVIPSFIIVLTLAFIYYKYRQLDTSCCLDRQCRFIISNVSFLAGWKNAVSNHQLGKCWLVCCCFLYLAQV